MVHALLAALAALVYLFGFQAVAPTAAAPAAPTNLVPPNNTTLTNFSPMLRWALPPDGVQYQLTVTPANNDGPAINVIRNAESTYTVPAPPAWYGLLPDMTYAWKVRATNANTPVSENDPSWGPWSVEHRFRTPAVAASSITLASPGNDAIILGLAPQLRWTDSNHNVWYYEVQLSKDPAFEADPAKATAAVYWELRHGGVTDPPRSYNLPAGYQLDENAIWYWRVRPRLQGDGRPVDWTAAARFRTGAIYAIARLTSTTDSTTVMATAGATLLVPPHAVPLDPSGAPGTVAFTIENNNVLSPTLQGPVAAVGWQQYGLSWVFGPTGFTFVRPVTVSLDVPAGTEPGQAVLYRFDLATGDWAIIGGDIDPVAWRISATVHHLSAYAVLVLPKPIWEARKAAGPGKLVVQNTSAPGSDAWVSVCVEAEGSAIRNPDADRGWLFTGLSALAAPSGTVGWPTEAGLRLPQGQYRLAATRLTAQGAAWQPYGGGTISIDSAAAFVPVPVDAASGAWTPGRAPCAGPELAAVGTGNVQVTLSWAAPIDLDLGIVEPDGVEVWFGNPLSASGGRLDRDTHCGNFQAGRPENVVWPAGTATPHGRFRVNVVYYRDCGNASGSVAYAVRALSGDRARTVFGRIDRVGDERTWFTFTYP